MQTETDYLGITVACLLVILPTIYLIFGKGTVDQRWAAIVKAFGMLIQVCSVLFLLILLLGSMSRDSHKDDR